MMPYERSKLVRQVKLAGQLELVRQSTLGRRLKLCCCLVGELGIDPSLIDSALLESYVSNGKIFRMSFTICALADKLSDEFHQEKLFCAQGAG